MSTIGPPAELTAHLRRQLSALAKTSPVTTRQAGTSQASSAHSTSEQSDRRATDAASSQPRHAESLASAIARRITAIDKADPDRRRKAFRVFLESLMLDEWGPQLINDPGFQQLVDNVQTQMESRADLRLLMDEAAGRLLTE